MTHLISFKSVLLLFLMATLTGCARNARLKKADDHFQQRAYAQAAPLYEDFYGKHQMHQRTPEVLFRLFVSYAATESEIASLDKARQWLEESKKYPANPYRSVAERILGLLDELESLSERSRGFQSRNQELEQRNQLLEAQTREKDEKLKQLDKLLEELRKVDLKKPRPPAR